jgi:GTP-binding protein EngB required for normal cell division
MPRPRNKKKKGKKLKDARTEDTLKVPDPQPTDLIIPIMGPTGVGKSTFINTASGENVALVGDELESCTSTIQPFIIPNNNRRIILVDTPGFDDTYVDDTEILRRIAVWLALSYNQNMKVAGIIYLHEISQTRMLGTSRKNFLMFNKLTGEEAAKDIVLATTKWSHITVEVGQKREQQLRNTHWKTMVDQGSKRAETAEPLQIQDELVYLQKRIPTTDAGTSLRNALNALLNDQRELAKQLVDEGLRDNKELQQRHEETQKRIRSTLDQIKALKVPLGARIMAVFFP